LQLNDIQLKSFARGKNITFIFVCKKAKLFHWVLFSCKLFYGCRLNQGL